MSDDPQRGRYDPLSRFLNLFADVKPGEGKTALLLSLNVFLLLAAYYTIKIVREALILAGSGAEAKSYASAGQVVVLIPFVWAYAKLADRLSRRALITALTLFFISNLVIFYALNLGGVDVGIAFFLWVGIFSRTILAQFWSFANDVYSREEGERLFPIVAIGSASGAVAGAYAVKALKSVVGGKIELWMLIASAILAFCLLLTKIIDARETARQGAGGVVEPDEADQPDGVDQRDEARANTQQSTSAEEEPGKAGAFLMVIKDSYLLKMALMILLLNWVNTTGEYIVSTLVESAAQAHAGGSETAKKAFIGAFYADFFLYVNIATMALQFFVVSRVIKWFGVRLSLFVLPAVALGGYSALALAPALAVVRWTKSAENALDYSLQNTAGQALFLVTSREAKYKAKQAIDTFFVRVGDVMSAVLVFAFGELKLGVRSFIFTAIGLAVVWLLIVSLVGRDYAKKAGAPRPA